MRQRPVNVRVKLVSILEDKSEDSLRHVYCIFIHISHNSQYYSNFLAIRQAYSPDEQYCFRLGSPSNPALYAAISLGVRPPSNSVTRLE